MRWSLRDGFGFGANELIPVTKTASVLNLGILFHGASSQLLGHQ